MADKLVALLEKYLLYFSRVPRTLGTRALARAQYSGVKNKITSSL